MDRHLLDQYHLLSSYVFLLQDPFHLPETGQRLGVLQRIDDQQDVMVNDRLISPSGEPGAGPGRKPFYGRLGETTEAVMKEIREENPLFFGKQRAGLETEWAAKW